MLHQIRVSSVLNKHKQRDRWFLTEYSVNPYEGCSCNCLYCYIRGSKYGENMEDGLAMKINGLEVLEKQLRARARKGQYGFVAVGSATDAYMHHEEKWKLTEGMLELLLKYRFPVFISTKSTLIITHVALLRQIDETAILPNDLKGKLNHGTILSVSISSMNADITNILEPGAATASERLRTLKQLKQEGFLVGVNAIPILPFISETEHELEKIVLAARQAGADYILTGGLTLFGDKPSDSRTLYFNFLKKFDPSLIPKYEQLYGKNFYPPRHYLSDLTERSQLLCAKHAIRASILNQHAESPQRNTAKAQSKLF